MRPPEMRPGGCTSRMIDSAVTDLPLPDSPTRPSVSPGRISKLTSSTAGAGPSGVSKTVVRCSTASSASGCRRSRSVGAGSARLQSSVGFMPWRSLETHRRRRAARRRSRRQSRSLRRQRRSAARGCRRRVRHASRRRSPCCQVAASRFARQRRARVRFAAARPRWSTWKRGTPPRALCRRNRFTPTTIASPRSMASCARYADS